MGYVNSALNSAKTPLIAAAVSHIHAKLPLVILKVESVIFTRPRSFAEYWKHFVARFNDVHTSGYNSAGNIRIRMKMGYYSEYIV